MAAKKTLKQMLEPSYPKGPPASASAILTLDKHDIDLIFDMIAWDEAVLQPCLKLLNAPNQNLRRAHVASLRVKLERIIQFVEKAAEPKIPEEDK